MADIKLSTLISANTTTNTGDQVLAFEDANNIAFSKNGEVSLFLRDGKLRKTVKSLNDLITLVEKPANCVTGYIDISKTMVHLIENRSDNTDKGSANFVDSNGFAWWIIDSKLAIAGNTKTNKWVAEYDPSFMLSIKNPSERKVLREMCKNPIFGVWRKADSKDELFDLIDSDLSKLFPLATPDLAQKARQMVN